MRVGIDTFTIRELGLDPFQTLDYISAHGLAGAQFGGVRSLSPTLDAGELRAVREYADGLGLYTYVSVPTPNVAVVGDRAAHREEIGRQIEAAAAVGWHELHSALGGPDERYHHAVPWATQLAEATGFIRELGPVLRAHGSRINLETHGDTTTFELARMAEEAGPDICGITLDTANVYCFGEDPVSAARRAAPYVHQTHTKDAIIFFCENGLRRQVRAPGQGSLAWEAILPILAEYEPDLPLSIEDHKWWYEVEIFQGWWHAQQADLTREELARTVQIAWQIERQIAAGEIAEPTAYEEIPYLEQLEERLHAGRDYLNGALERLSLQSEASNAIG